MSNENDLRSRLVPAICTQCGGQVQVDPSQEAAVCQYCGTPFIVEKAIQNYSIQNAKIEHVDTVNINTKSTAESFFGFLGQQMSESREVRREERREQRAADRESQKMFFKIFGYMDHVHRTDHPRRHRRGCAGHTGDLRRGDRGREPGPDGGHLRQF